MSEQVLHEFTDSEGRIWIVCERKDGIVARIKRYSNQSYIGPEIDKLARLAARVAELEGENAKLRACVEAADLVRGDDCCPVCDSEQGQKHWIDCPWRDYDAARAEVDNG